VHKIIFIALFLGCLIDLCTGSAGQDSPPLASLEPAVLAICRDAPAPENIVGTGFIVSQSGLVLTADHVVTDADGRPYGRLFALQPLHPSANSLALKVLRRFREGTEGRDLALLQIEPDQPSLVFPHLEIGGAPQTGDEVVLLGFPLVFDQVYVWPLLRTGVVASTSYSYQGSSILVLDLATVPGYSGSPVIDRISLRAIGVVRGPSTRNSGFTVATPVTAADLWANEK
jgi:S1-C subfamily serine protease